MYYVFEENGSGVSLISVEYNLMFDILFVFKRCLTGKVRSRNLSAQKPNQLNWKNLDAANITLFFI